jgi:uncharacterized membrane protein
VKENVGRTERIVRIVVGASVAAASLTQIRRHPILALVGAVAGALVTETGVTRVCPLNTAFGIDTRSTAERMQDFRTEINEESDRITEAYSKPIAIDDLAHS